MTLSIEELAGRLTEAQRRAIWRAVTTRGIAQKLLRMGLVRTTEACDGVGTLLTLSAAGEQVRAHMQESDRV